MTYERLLGKRSNEKLFLIRWRGGISVGISNGDETAVVNAEGTTRFEDWLREKVKVCEGATEGTYLIPLSERQMKAEISFRVGVVKAFIRHELREGLHAIEESLREDATNVEAHVAAARIEAILGRHNECINHITAAREFDNRHPLLPGLVAGCSASN
jgi:hypothetical protein